MSLQPPRDESLNGLLQGYRIYYRELESETSMGPEAKTLKSPSALRAELTAQSSFKTVNSSSTLTTYELTHLKKYRRYEVIMTAYNIIGESPASVPVEVFVGEAGLVYSNRALCSAQQIYYWEVDSRNETEKLKVLFLPEPVVKIKNLTSHTKYLVSISAFNAAGLLVLPPVGDYEQRAMTVSLLLCPALKELSSPVLQLGYWGSPGPPSFLAFSEITSTTLNVSWGEPSAANGILQGYRVVYEPLAPTDKEGCDLNPGSAVHVRSSEAYDRRELENLCSRQPMQRLGHRCLAGDTIPHVQLFTMLLEHSSADLEGMEELPPPVILGVSKVVTVDVKGNWQRWLKVRDLTKGVTYFFRVQARTITYGPELQANVTAGPAEGSPGSPRNVLVTKSASELTLQWTEGNAGSSPTTGYVIEARPSGGGTTYATVCCSDTATPDGSPDEQQPMMRIYEGLWDMFAKDIPRSATSYTVGLDKLRQGVTYEFRVVAVNKAGFGEPSRPSTAVSAQAEVPFYEEWWFLLVMALSSLLLVLLVVFALVLHGQSKKYKNCGTGKGISNMEESVTLDNGGSPPRPSPGGLHYSDEDICNKYNGAVLTESVNLKEKSVDGSESEASDSDYEEALPKHSFVNHYMSDPTYYNSWKRRPPAAAPHRYEAVAGAESGPHLHTVITTQSAGGVYTPAGPGARAPLTGFSSFV
ncbi:hypothetical protein A6R68_11025 [Neotoma lepida]|uniref:Fibronectin type-III domain-containing protein n=1 Tax=Neotoma lepida TaxID=56216 RepID=A0A1A6FXF8_NEOLE|nr:hypothetical protein A6R68_11025 [Neotoma lepida]